MNKIYKVIWSKVRNCYVAVSEIAKRNGKSCTSMNCGVKAKGSRAVLALALALSVTGGAVFTMPQMARAADITITSGSVTISDDTHAADDYYLNGSGITFTVNAGGVVNSISGNSDAAVSGNTVTINGGTVKNADTDWIEYPAGSGNWVVGKPNLTGGFSTSDTASDNHVVIKNATIGGYYPTAYGGYSRTGTVSKNSVTVESENPNLYVYGGHSDIGVVGGDTAADGNIVTVKSGAVVYVAGGSSDSGDVKNNKAVIEGGTVANWVAGGYSGGAVSNNVVTISGSSTAISGTGYEPGVYGGYSFSGTKAVSDNHATISDGATVNTTVYGGYMYSGTGAATGNKVDISGGKVTNDVYGGYMSGTGAATGNKVDISQTDTEVLTKIDGNVYGGYSESGTAGGAMAGEGNKVTITGGTVGTNVYGGRSNSGVASGNIVTITGGTVSGAVYGGYGNTANGNTVTISGGVVEDKIVGGAPVSGVANNNTVNLKGATDLSSASLAGTSNATDYSGDELHVGGVKGDTTNSNNTNNIWTSSTNNKVKGVRNFETIALHSVAWNTDVAVLEANSVDNIGKLDITGMTIYGSSNAGEKMSLLSSGYDISSIKLKYNDSEAVSLVNNPVTIGGGAYTDKVIIADLLKFSGTSADTVSLATDNKAIVYTAGESSVSSATFSGTADWSTSAALYSNSSYKFDTNATTNLADLKFSDTTVTEDPMNKTMTLISGNVQGTVSAQPTDSSISVSLAKSNTTLGGTATGAAAIDGGNLAYTINNVALESVAVTAAGDTPDALPTGWTKGSAVTVNTGATALDRATGATILSSDTAGLFTGATFSGVNDYNDAANNKHAFASDAAKGVMLDGTQQKGIKASDDGKSLVYAVNDTKDVATITLGTVKTDDPRDMSGTDFDFANTTKVDASALKLDVAEPLSISSPVIPLVANATGLTAGVSVDYGEGKTSHSQDVPLTHADTGIVLNATVNGTVATVAGAVNYTVTGGTLNSVVLSNWNGTAAGILPSRRWRRGSSLISSLPQQKTSSVP